MKLELDRPTLFFLPWLLFTMRYGILPYFYVALSRLDYWGMAVLVVGGLLLSLALQEALRLGLCKMWDREEETFRLSLLGTPAPLELSGSPRFQRVLANTLRVATGCGFAAAFLTLCSLSGRHVAPQWLSHTWFHLACANATLAAIQLLPVLPLDGGRALLHLMSPDGRPRIDQIATLAGVGLRLSLLLGLVGIVLTADGKPIPGAWAIVLSVLLLEANMSEKARLLS